MFMNQRIANIAFVVAVAVAAIVLSGGIATAQSLQGVINGRSGNTMTVQGADGTNTVVVLNDSTSVEEESGAFHARRKQMSMAALVPGLQVSVQGSYNAQNQLVANTVKFNGKNLQTATDIQAGVTPVEQQEQAQQQKIAQQQQELAQQQAQIQQTQEEQAQHAAEIAKQQAAIAAVNKRFGELGDYNIWDKVDVLFGNGKVNLDPQYQPKLLALCQKAKTVNGYVIQVKGYASNVGSAALNQKLSQERAANVIDFLEQKGGIPLTNVLAPGAMGTSKQVAPDNTAEGQAENRRVTVLVLQNKGIAGN
jgi:outer membrane protein OmpA-like peptidoglycan-associated protein